MTSTGGLLADALMDARTLRGAKLRQIVRSAFRLDDSSLPAGRDLCD